MNQYEQAVLLASFNDELEKIASERGMSPMEKEAFLRGLRDAAGKRGRQAMLGLGLLSAGGAGTVAKVAPDAPVVQQAMKHVPGTAAHKASLDAAKKADLARRVEREMAIRKSYADRGISPADMMQQRAAVQAANAARY